MKKFEFNRIAATRPKSEQNVYPGYRQMTVEQVRNFIKNQKRAAGFEFDLVTGDNTGLDVEISGNARVLLGFAIAVPEVETEGFSSTLYNANFDLEINNEIVLRNVNLRFLSKDFTDEDYYFFPRPLDGQDDVKVNFRNVETEGKYYLIIYYL